MRRIQNEKDFDFRACRQYDGIPCLVKLSIWARVCVYKFLKKKMDGCVTNAPESDVPIENAVNFLTEYNRIHESIVL